MVSCPCPLDPSLITPYASTHCLKYETDL
jgi:hypothetical protein